MSNPFESPKPVPAGHVPPEMDAGRMARSGLLRQLPVLGVLMIVQGTLVLLMGLGLIALGVFMPQFMEAQMAQEMQGQSAAEASAAVESARTIMLVMYGGFGVVLAIVGGLGIYAGIRIISYRGRVLGIVALSVGFVPVITCYCAPTGIALGIYGLIVLLNSDVVLAFQLKEQGCTTDQVKYGDW